MKDSKLSANHTANTELIRATTAKLSPADQESFSCFLIGSLCATYPPKAFADLVAAVLVVVKAGKNSPANFPT